MTAFHFRLDALLLLRRAARDACRMELGAAHVERQRLSSARQALEPEIERQAAVVRAALGGGPLDIGRLRGWQRHEAALRAEQAELLLQEQRACGEVDRCRAALAVAEREVQVLEKLRQRQHQQHRQRQGRVETRELDEMAARMRRNTA